MAHIDPSIEFLHTQITALQQQNLDLQQQNFALQEQIIALHSKLDERDQVILELRANLTTMQDLLFGKSSEQAQNGASVSDTKDGAMAPNSGKGGGSKGKKGEHRKRRNHEKLPLVETTIDLTEDKKRCPCCGLDFQYVNDVEEGETTEIEVKGYRKKIRRRSYARKCKCPDGGPKIITAPSPGKLIPKGSIGTSVWIKMLLDKFLFYVPTYRVLDQLQLEGIDLPQSTINDGMFKLKILLEPIYEAICEKNRQEDRWHADETGWLVQEKIV